MTKYTGGVIEQAAKVLSRAWKNMYTNESLGYQRMLAGSLADAGLLARPLPSRDEIADTIYDALEEGGWISTSGYYPYEVADAVLALLKGTKE